MDHQTIEDAGLAELYLLGRLPAEEREAFEDHFLDCPECLERLEMARRMRDGLARIALEEGAKATAVQRLGVFAALARLAGSRRAGLLVTAVLVAALVPAGAWWRQAARQERELTAAREALAEARRTAPPPGLPEELAAARRELAAERETSRRERERLAGELAESRRPQTRVSVFTLSPERSGPDVGEPATRITLAPSPEWIVLSLDVGSLDPGEYRATLRREGRQVWQGSGLRPDPAGAMAVSFPSGSLAPGDYELEIATSPRSGRPAPVAGFRFRIRQGR